MDITQLRQEIDKVDQQLLQLFAQRMEISSQIADYKKEQNIPIFDPVREREKLSNVASSVQPELQSAAKVLYSLLFELSRSYQSSKNATETALFHRITESIENTPKLFPPQAMIACVGQENDRLEHLCQRLTKNPSTLFFSSKEAVFSAVAQGMCCYGLLPLENTGVYDLLSDYQFYIVRSFRMQNSGGSFMHFILFSKELEIYPGADKTTLVMTLPNKPGSLYRVLARLYTLGLNIAKLASKPDPKNDYRMLFYFDLETSIYSQEFVHLMCELDDLCEDFQYLGSYTEVV